MDDGRWSKIEESYWQDEQEKAEIVRDFAKTVPSNGKLSIRRKVYFKYDVEKNK